MKKLIVLIFALMLMLSGCGQSSQSQIAATTLPVYEFTSRLCEGTGLSVTRLITENVSCLHDYTLKVDQMRAIESADLVIMNGAGLEDFMEDALHSSAHIIDSSAGLSTMEGHHHDNDNEHAHVHLEDPHIWLSPENAQHMVSNICAALCSRYPEHEAAFIQNREKLISDLEALQTYGEQKLSDLSCRQLITFHDGFAYLAESFGLEILEAIEEESGSEASAAELIRLTELVREHQLPAIFIETNGSVSAASIISAETGIPVYALDMAMSGDSYFDSMYRNIDILWEALQ